MMPCAGWSIFPATGRTIWALRSILPAMPAIESGIIINGLAILIRPSGGPGFA